MQRVLVAMSLFSLAALLTACSGGDCLYDPSVCKAGQQCVQEGDRFVCKAATPAKNPANAPANIMSMPDDDAEDENN